LVPEISFIKKQLLELGCDHCMMTGSGSVVMGFSQDHEHLKLVAETLKSQYRFVKITKVLD
jgi:4-diphosphocytidyl-2C-methyl-D-erythritol kinase